MPQANPQKGRPPRAALVGCGAVARQVHAPILTALADVELVGVTDRSRPLAKALAGDFDVPFHSDDLSRLLREAQPELVHVLTPPSSHEEVAVAALEQGCHVIIEKPFAPSLAEAERILQAADRSSAQAAAIHNYLAHPAVEELLRQVRAGEIGDLCSVHFLHGRRDQRYVPSPWYFDSHGGRLGETIPHAVYLLLALLPELQVQYVRARHLGHVLVPDGVRRGTDDVDEVRVELGDPDGRYATILYSLNCDLPQTLIATGTGGTLQAWISEEGNVERWSGGPPSTHQLVHAVRSFVKGRVLPRLGIKPRATPAATPHGRQIARLVAALRSGAPLPDQQVREVVRLSAEIAERYETARRGGDASAPDRR